MSYPAFCMLPAKPLSTMRPRRIMALPCCCWWWLPPTATNNSGVCRSIWSTAMAIEFTSSLHAQYKQLYARATIRPEHRATVVALATRMADEDHWPRYVSVAGAVGVPPHLVALIHVMECGLRFDRHLHNGDPLTGRTVRIPEGRPTAGNTPSKRARSSSVTSLRRLLVPPRKRRWRPRSQPDRITRRLATRTPTVPVWPLWTPWRARSPRPPQASAWVT